MTETHPAPEPSTPTPSTPAPSSPTLSTPAPSDPERGDVPGWVLVTLMTAGLVLALWAVAGPALVDLFEQAMARVTSGP